MNLVDNDEQSYELFSKGSITREEYDAKTSELFKDYVKPKKQ